MYIQMEKPMPVCNPRPSVDNSNIGWCKGVMDDGIPFVAELWETVSERGVTFYLPFQERFLPDWMGIVFHPDVYKAMYPEALEPGGLCDESVLLEGMEQMDIDSAVLRNSIMDHVAYLKEAGLIAFTGDCENGGLQVLRDFAGRAVVSVHISMGFEGETEAETPLEFEEFTTWEGKKIYEQERSV